MPPTPPCPAPCGEPSRQCQASVKDGFDMHTSVLALLAPAKKQLFMVRMMQ